MDIDRALDDMIPKRKPRSSGGARGAGAGAERSERRKSRGSDAPYAVSLPSPLTSTDTLLYLADRQRPPPRSTEEKWVHDAFEGGRKPSTGFGAGQMPVTASPRIEVSGVHYEVTPEELKVRFGAWLVAVSKLTGRACSSRRGRSPTAPRSG